MQTLLFREIELIEENEAQKSLAQVTVRLDCRSCTAKSVDCHRRCPQMTAVCSEKGKLVTGELLQKGKRARVHKDVNITFGKFMGLVGEKENGDEE